MPSPKPDVIDALKLHKESDRIGGGGREIFPNSGLPSEIVQK